MPALPRGRSALLRALVGSRCQVCAQPLEPSQAPPLCPDCLGLLTPRTGGFCPLCGTCYADASADVYPCLHCRTTPPPWTHLAFHGLYAGVLKDLIHEFKFRHDHGLRTLLRCLLAQILDRHPLPCPDWLVPVPMTDRGLVRRGFNQSAEIASLLCAQLGGTVRTDALSKVRDTALQSSLGRAARKGNVRGAFAASIDVAGKTVLLVDDVMTTGATLTSCARTCLQRGAARVDVLVLARAM